MSTYSTNDLFVHFQMMLEEVRKENKKDGKLSFQYYKFTEITENKVKAAIREAITSISDFKLLVEDIKTAVLEEKAE